MERMSETTTRLNGAAPAAHRGPFAPPRRGRGSLGRALAVPLLLAAGACGGSVGMEEEAQMGAAYAAEINQQLPLVQDPAAVAELNRIGEALAARADSVGRDYTFYLVDSPDVNAFAIPGGHIYVNRGLVERADELSELAGVLAHEIAHVAERHGIEQVEKQRSANLLLTLLYTLLGREPGLLEQVAIQGGGAAVFAKHGRDAEREADRRAVEILLDAGYHPAGMATFFEELLRHRQRSPVAVEQWFATHPLTEERIRNAREAIGERGIPDEASLVRNTRRYESFRERVAALP